MEYPKPLLRNLKLLCMKKFNTLLKNDNVQATLIIASIFLIAGFVTLYALSR